MRVLVTGAGGQLGHDLVEILRGEQVSALTHHDLDIADREAVRDAVTALRPEWIINAAAYNNVDGAEDHEALAMAVNAAGPAHLADAALRVGARLVHISTDYVFDGRKGAPYVEEDAPNPLSVYGRSKYEGERRVLESGASACVIRTAWLYGEHGSNFVKSILAATEQGRPLRVVADQVGSPTSTADLARAIAEVLRRPVEGLFHLANAGACSRFEQAQAIVGDQVEVIAIATTEAGRRAARPANSALASDRWEIAGFTPLRPWRNALDEFLGRVRGQPSRFS